MPESNALGVAFGTVGDFLCPFEREVTELGADGLDSLVFLAGVGPR